MISIALDVLPHPRYHKLLEFHVLEDCAFRLIGVERYEPHLRRYASVRGLKASPNLYQRLLPLPSEANQE
jgi:hypothetical protein